MRGFFAATLALIGTQASAQVVIPPPALAPLPVPDQSLLTLGTAQDRMTVPVTIGGRGPWAFIIDTGAERTVISRELAGVLGLAAAPPIRLTSLTGTQTVSTVVLPGLGVSRIAHVPIQAPALQARDIGAQGLLGVDALQGHAVGIDFDSDQMTLRPSGRRRSAAVRQPDEIVVVARSLFGQLIVSNARWRGKRIAVVIDTGSPVSVGNRLLAKLFGTAARALGPVSVSSVTGQELVADAVAVDDIGIGGATFMNVPVAISDGAAFARLGLAGKPAMLLGMDALRLFRHVEIDFANREIRFTLPRGARPAPRPFAD